MYYWVTDGYQDRKVDRNIVSQDDIEYRYTKHLRILRIKVKLPHITLQYCISGLSLKKMSQIYLNNRRRHTKKEEIRESIISW